MRKPIYLNEKKDADILAWWTAQTNASAAIREAIRWYIGLRGSFQIQRIIEPLNAEEPDDLKLALDGLGE